MIKVFIYPKNSKEYILAVMRHTSGVKNELSDIIVNWIIANKINGYVLNDVEAYFENEEDALAFKLRFEV